MKDQAQRRVGDWRRAAAVLMPLATLAILLLVSSVTGPSFAELERLRAVSRAETVVLEVASRGVEALTGPPARAVYDSFGGRGTGFVLFAAWSKLSIGRVGLLDPITAARLPWLVLAALAPSMIFLVVRPSRGRRVAWLAAGLLAFTPRWLHGAVVGEPGVWVGSVWLVVLAAHLRVLAPTTRARPARPAFWAAVAALALGVGAAASLAALWILPILVVHHWLARWQELGRRKQSGMVPLPASVVFAAVLVPPVVFASNPALWGSPLAHLVRWALGPLGAQITPTAYAGEVISSPPLPAGFTLGWLFATLPLVVLVCALLGLVACAHHGLARRFATGSLRPPRDRQALASLVGVGLSACVFGPALAPELLTTFPPRVELALPFVAIAAAIALEHASLRALPRAPGLVSGIVVAAVAVLALRAPSTNSAQFDSFFGGARCATSGGFAVGDGSELGVMAARIDELDHSQLSLTAPGVPPDLWATLHEAGRMRTVITTGGSGAGSLRLSRGPGEGQALAAVQRDGVALWRLSAR